jgi:hypothetical protein
LSFSYERPFGFMNTSVCNEVHPRSLPKCVCCFFCIRRVLTFWAWLHSALERLTQKIITKRFLFAQSDNAEGTRPRTEKAFVQASACVLARAHVYLITSHSCGIEALKRERETHTHIHTHIHTHTHAHREDLWFPFPKGVMIFVKRNHQV